MTAIFTTVNVSGEDFSVCATSEPCVKCGCDRVKVYWHPGIAEAAFDMKSPGCHAFDIAKEPGEHLHVYCQVCRFAWVEPVKESKSK